MRKEFEGQQPPAKATPEAIPDLPESRVLGRIVETAGRVTVEARHFFSKTRLLGSMLNRVMRCEEGNDLKPFAREGAALFIIADFMRNDVGLNYLDGFSGVFKLQGVCLEDVRELAREGDMSIRWSKLQSLIKDADGSVINDSKKLVSRLEMTSEDRKGKAKRMEEASTRAYNAIGSGLDEERERIVKAFNGIAPDKMGVQFEFDSVALMPSGVCGLGCRHCRVCYTKPGIMPQPERHEAWREALDIARERNLNVVISGTEPLKAREDALHIIRNSSSNTFMTTNARWAGTIESTRSVLKDVSSAAREVIAKGKTFTLQVSFDSFHQEPVLDGEGKLREKVPVANIANVIHLIVEEFSEINLNLIMCETPESRLLINALSQELGDRKLKMHMNPEEKKVPEEWGWHKYQYYEVDPDGREREVEVCNYQIIITRPDGGWINDHSISLSRDRIRVQGRAKALDTVEYTHVRTNEMEEVVRGRQMKGDYPTIIVDNTGRTFLYDNSCGGDFTCAGDASEGKIKDILELRLRDPLFMFREVMPGYIIGLMRMADSDILDEIRRLELPNLDDAVSHIISNPARRLYLTKIIIQQLAKQGFIGDINLLDFEVLQQMGLNVRPSEIIEEYHKNRQAELST